MASKAPDLSNGLKADEMEKLLGSIDDADTELLDLKMSHMTACKGPRSRIRDTCSLVSPKYCRNVRLT